MSVKQLQEFLKEKSLASLEKYLIVHVEDLRDKILKWGADLECLRSAGGSKKQSREEEKEEGEEVEEEEEEE